VSECDRESSIMRRPWPTGGCCGTGRNIQTCDTTTACFGIFRPSSGRYSTKKNTIIAIYALDVRCKRRIQILKWLKRLKSMVQNVYLII
jgi:hypothetical protein